MKKAIVAFSVSAVLVIALAGCSQGESSPSQGSSAEPAVESSAVADTSAAPSESSLFASEEWPQNYVTEEVPAPSFSVGIDTLTVSDISVSAIWKDVPESEVAAYAEELKQAGFEYGAMETKASDRYSYSAQNSENILKCTSVILSYTNDGYLSLFVDRSDN